MYTYTIYDDNLGRRSTYHRYEILDILTNMSLDHKVVFRIYGNKVLKLSNGTFCYN